MFSRNFELNIISVDCSNLSRPSTFQANLLGRLAQLALLDIRKDILLNLPNARTLSIRFYAAAQLLWF